MKIIIEHSETKREISGAFNVCGSERDLRLIAESILAAIKDGWTYGWVRIPSEPGQSPIVNTAPVDWDHERPATEPMPLVDGADSDDRPITGATLSFVVYGKYPPPPGIDSIYIGDGITLERFSPAWSVPSDLPGSGVSVWYRAVDRNGHQVPIRDGYSEKARAAYRLAVAAMQK